MGTTLKLDLKRSEAGFSLVELMITISIIAVLIAASLFSYSNIQRRARDATRQSDLKIIQSALEQYKADQGFYPTSITYGTALTYGTGSTLRTYLNKIPQDIATTGYVYRALPSTPTQCQNSTVLCSNYCLFAKLENTTSTPSTPPTVCGSYPTNYNFFVTQP